MLTMVRLTRLLALILSVVALMTDVAMNGCYTWAQSTRVVFVSTAIDQTVKVFNDQGQMLLFQLLASVCSSHR